jgi:hypothetical protein
MELARNHHDGTLGAKAPRHGATGKSATEHISESIDLSAAQTVTGRREEAPPLVRDLSPQERQRAERLLVRKIDIRILPMIIFMYILNYLDRNSIASARLAGLETDLNLSSTQYNVWILC